MPSGSQELIVEHQRGLMVLGYPVFTPNLLIRGVDPPQFQILVANGEKVEADEIKAGAGMYPLDLNSKPKGFKWFVSIDHGEEYDTDDQGWCYGWMFRGHNWKSKNGFVRKRFWTRLPIKPDDLSPGNKVTEEPIELRKSGEADQHNTELVQDKLSPEETLLTSLNDNLIDRQRLEKIQDFLRSISLNDAERLFAANNQFLEQILGTLQFDDTRKKLLDDLIPKELAEKKNNVTLRMEK